MKYTNLIGQKVVSIFDGKIDSYVIDILFSKNGKISKIILADIENENSKVLEFKNIFCFGKDCIMVKNCEKILVGEFSNKNPLINKDVFDVTGNFLGKVCEIEIIDYYISKICTESNSFDIKDIISLSGVIVINKNTKFKKHNFSPKKQNILNTKSSQPVTVLSSKIPIKVTAHTYLVGKKLFKDLVGYGGTILATKNSIVSSQLLNLAKQHNVLTELSRSVY